MVDQIQEAIDWEPHKSVLSPDAIDQLQQEVAKKVATGQACLVDWNDIKHNPPSQLKVSPISMIPHKLRKYRTILDLSFVICLADGTRVPSVNKAINKTAPGGAINQIGQSLRRINHAFAASVPDELFLCQNGISRMDFGNWTVNRARNGTLHMSFPNIRAQALYWLCQTPFKWGGLSHPLLFAPSPKPDEIRQLTTSKLRWVHVLITNSSANTRQPGIPEVAGMWHSTQ